jgi:hypothetical protein
MSLEFEFSKGAESVPAGMYKAAFARVEDREKNEHGESVRFVWTVEGGEYDGREATRIVGIDRPPTAKNGLGRILSGLAGKQYEPGDKIRPDEFVGKVYLLDVKDAPGGNGTRVETCMPNM